MREILTNAANKREDVLKKIEAYESQIEKAHPTLDSVKP